MVDVVGCRLFFMGEIGLCEDRNLSRPLFNVSVNGNREYKYRSDG